jgi:ribonuclease/clavin/mitogillin
MAGIPPAPPVSKPRDAAVAILYRPAGNGFELFWMRREAKLFAGGFYAFPGGRVDAEDAHIPVAGAEGDAATFRVAAARELFEETGVLVARGASGLSPSALAQLREALLGKKQSFQALLTGNRLELAADDFLEAGRWITPPFLPVRFDTRFFVVRAPEGAVAEVSAGEASEGGWVAPRDALVRWGDGTALLHPPNLQALQVFGFASSVAQALPLLQQPPYCPGHVATRLEFQRGIRMFPLETPTLPPARHTNVYILGNGELLIVDPGAAVVRQYSRLLALVAGLKSEGMRPRAVFLTHHHADHLGGAQAVKERLGIPIWCHARTAERLPFAVDQLFEDGQVITLSGLPTMRWRVLHTPGHARGHLCLLDEATRAAVVGDMISSLSTIVIDPPEGDMSDYMAQLARLEALPVTTVYPAHGPAVPDGPAKLREYIHHREQREQWVFSAVKRAHTLPEIVAQAYSDTPEVLHPIAERSALAVLIKLVREGKVVRNEDRYSVASGAA